LKLFSFYRGVGVSLENDPCVFIPQIHYLMCLAANYAHIRDHEKFQELQELQYLQDPELSVAGSKDRF
jgi:hypothetical protein